MTNQTTLHDVKTLILSFHPVLAIETLEEERVRDLLKAVGAELHMPVFEWSVTRGLQRLPGGTAIHGTADPHGLMKHLRSISVQGIFHLKDFSPFLGEPTLVRLVRDAADEFARTRATLVITGDPIELPVELASQAVQFRLQLPTERELREELDAVVRSLSARHRLSVELTRPDVDEIVRALSGLTLSQARHALAYVMLDDGRLAPDDVRKLIDRKAHIIQESGLLEYFPAGDNRFELGGFDRLKQWLERAYVGFTAEARALNLPAPKGVLILGVQGCGKSLAAKVIAREWRLPLLKLDAGRLYDKYVGETERNFRRVIELAQAMAPAVLWVDEIEKGFGGASSESDGGVSQRLLGSLLAWLQERPPGVFLVATANDIRRLPPELLRKGRFDEVFFVDLPDSTERAAILGIHLRLRKQQPERFDLGALVAASEGFSGAEIEQAVVAALYRALHRRTTLDGELLLNELRNTVPLSVARLEEIEQLRQMAAGRFVPVR